MPDFNHIFLKKQSDFNSAIVNLPASKSIANRALIIRALANGNEVIENLSEARDTQTMRRLLAKEDFELDVLDAGTTMRFLTAYLTVTNQHKILTGSERMQQRPIKLLVDALKELGATINYKRNEGYPPIEIIAFNDNGTKEVSINGEVSSQYISALLMIGPLLKNGLILTLTGRIGSRPYIEMTLSVMRSFGIESSFEDNVVKIDHQKYQGTTYTVEPDWSAASYWYSLVALSENSSVTLKGLAEKSIQGDSVIQEIMKHLGVTTKFTQEGALLTKSEHKNYFDYNFTDCPDLAQTVAVVCAAKGIEASFTGLESLKIKETDRVLALHNELAKINCQLVEEGSTWSLIPSKIDVDNIFIETYEDHRMAMAFAPLCLKLDVTIEDKTVVNKSYPNYWKDYQLVGLFSGELE